LGRTCLVYVGADRRDRFFRVVPEGISMKAHFLPFVAALVVFGIVFFALDFSVMKLQGLALIYRP